MRLQISLSLLPDDRDWNVVHPHALSAHTMFNSLASHATGQHKGNAWITTEDWYVV
jgi:hypothetical protein